MRVYLTYDQVDQYEVDDLEQVDSDDGGIWFEAPDDDGDGVADFMQKQGDKYMDKSFFAVGG